MKILKEGKIPEPPQPWWVGKHHKCSHCRTEIEFEVQDKITEHVEKALNGRRWFTFSCPFCGKLQDHIQITMR